jgi:L-gulonate 3-dehydrogenase
MKDRTALVGAGMIGRAWAIVFASAGHPVALWDPVPGVVDGAMEFIASQLSKLVGAGLVMEPVDTIAARIVPAVSLEACVAGAAYVQENGPEALATRRDLFARLDALLPSETIIASSTSGMPASAFTESLAHRERCLIAHPANPPYLLPLVELCPAPWTSGAVIERATALLVGAGRQVALLQKEREGFLLNRLQGAMLAEAFRLLSEGVVSVEALDTVVKHGLGLRWAFMGPIETVDLNAPGGIVDFCARYGTLYESLQHQMLPMAWTDAVVAPIAQARRQTLPQGDISARQAWRDDELMALAVHLAGRREKKI